MKTSFKYKMSDFPLFTINYFRFMPVVFAMVGLVNSCEESENKQFTDSPIVESYLLPGDFLNVKVSRQIPFSDDPDYSADDIDNLAISVVFRDTTYQLISYGEGIYGDSSLIVSEGDDFTLTFEFNSKTVKAYTYIPSKPVNYTQSVTSISIDRMDSTSGPPSGEQPDPVQFSWENADATYYLMVIENMETTLDPIADFGDDDERPDRMFRKSPTNSYYVEINPMDFQYFGKHRVILFHVLPDYSALYEDNSNSSLNLTNPSTSVTNGYGIFTGLNSDTLYVNVIEN